MFTHSALSLLSSSPSPLWLSFYGSLFCSSFCLSSLRHSFIINAPFLLHLPWFLLAWLDDKRLFSNTWKVYVCLSLFVSLSGQYFASIMIIVGMSVIATVVVLQYHHHDPNGGKMPKWVRLFTHKHIHNQCPDSQTQAAMSLMSVALKAVIYLFNDDRGQQKGTKWVNRMQMDIDLRSVGADEWAYLSVLQAN